MKKIFLSLFIFVLSLALTGCGKTAISGKYKCFSFYDETETIVLELDLNNDKSFRYKTDVGEVKGDYTYKIEDKTFEDARYYMVTLNPKDAIYQGEKVDLKDSIEFEFAFEKHGKKKEGLVFFTSSYNMYYCRNY